VSFGRKHDAVGSWFSLRGVPHHVKLPYNRGIDRSVEFYRSRGNRLPTLDKHPMLSEFQRYVAELEVERGFEHQTVTDKCLLLGEEIGELFKAVRHCEGLKVDPDSSIGEVEHELADVFIYVCAIANRYNIDLEQAFRDKETLNHQRQWISPDPTEGRSAAKDAR